MKKIITICICLLFLGLMVFVTYIFYPRQYDVLPHVALDNTSYWNLSTGSTIGYVLLKAKGQKKSSPIIYLHGGPGGSISDYIVGTLMPFTEAGYDIYLYDQIGSGSSARLDHIREYTAERHIRDLVEIVKEIGANKVILIGQSWGSVLATFFVADNPTLIEKIIMTGPGPIFPINKHIAEVKAPDSLNLRVPVFSNHDANELFTFRDMCIRKYAYISGNKLISDDQVDDFFTYFNGVLKRSTVCDTANIKESPGGGGYYSHFMTFKSLGNMEDPRARIKTLQTPVLILKGQCDNQKWGFTQEYFTYFENSKLVVIAGAGHDIAAEHPESYSNEIKEFLID